jgi:hypothetical protein
MTGVLAVERTREVFEGLGLVPKILFYLLAAVASAVLDRKSVV